MATAHPAQTTSDRPGRVASLVAYLALVGGLVAAATLSAVYVASAASLGLVGFVVVAGAWLGAVAASPGLARRVVEGVTARAGGGDVDQPAVTSGHAPPTAPK